MSDATEKKIIIDEDWKAKVEAEREAAKQEPPTAPPASEERSAAPPLPPASLVFLATTLYYQAIVSLGLAPDPLTGKPKPRLSNARHTIDMLEMLWEKTEGNRTDEESQALEAMLHELRMAYVEVMKKE